MANTIIWKLQKAKKMISILIENEPEIEIFQKMSEIAFGHEEFIWEVIKGFIRDRMNTIYFHLV